MAVEPVSTVLWPLHMLLVPLMVMVGVGVTVTVIVLLAEQEPLAPVNVYVVLEVGLTEIVFVVMLPGIQV